MGEEVSWYWQQRTFGISEVQKAVKDRIKKSTRNKGSQKLDRNIQTASLGALNTERGKYKPKEASDREINKTLIPRGLTNRSTCAILNTNFNLLKPTGYVTHQQFNIQQLYILPTLYLCVLYLSEKKQRLVPLQHKLIGFYNGEEKCLLHGTNQAFK